jgi:uncharacterized protein YwqG
MARTNPEVWQSFLAERRFPGDLSALWASLVRPNVQLVPGPVLDADMTLTGASKLGGDPDLPGNVSWPLRAGREPLTFLAQVNLAELSKCGSGLPLPDDGLLSFFYDAETQPWGFDPADVSGTQVLYIDGGATVERRRHPKGRPSNVRTVQLVPGECLPSWEPFQDKAAAAGFVSRRVSSEIDKLSGEDLERITYGGHAVGGWPALIQDQMELECQLASNGIDVGGPEGYETPRAQELAPGAADWRLLLQLDDDEDLGWAWGDAGRLYFWCREQDMAARRFDRCWTVLQCF